MAGLSQRRYASELTADLLGKRATIAGWLQDVRNQGKIAFFFVRDRTGVVQVVAKLNDVGAERFARYAAVPRESVVALTGLVNASKAKAGGYEILLDAEGDLTVLNAAATPLPLGVVDKVAADIETRLDNRFLDLRKPEIAAVFAVRSEIVGAGVEWFRRNGFAQIHTPRVIGSASEGGTDLFKVRYFERDAYLSQSPQLYKQMMMASGLDRVFEVATYFRAEKHNTPRHLNEITAFDAEIAFVESEEDVLRALEGLLGHIWQSVAQRCAQELATLGVTLPVPPARFLRIPYADAVERANATGRLAQPVTPGEDLSAEAERVLGEELRKEGHDFYFLTRYPEAVRPFYTYVDDNGRDSRSFDLEYRGLEITSGAQREHRPDKLAARIEHKGLNPADFEGYLKAFRYGMPPHGGFGMGIDRLVMVMLGLDNIREGVLFPRDRTRLAP